MTGTEPAAVGRGEDVPEPPARSMRPTDLLALMRPRHWTKNVLVFVAPGAAGLLTDATAVMETLGAFAAFSLAASGTYALNDASDAEADRRHPEKSRRPVASGRVPVGVAVAFGVALVVSGIALGFVVSVPLGITVAGYIGLTTAYTTVLKHLPIADLLAVASGFVLRAIGGAAAVEVEVSQWFLIVATSGALLMVTGKRIAELGLTDAARHRSALAGYSPPFLGQVLTVATTTSLLAYALFAFERSELSDASVPWFELSLVPFTYGILRYLWHVDRGDGGDPTDLAISDRALLVAGTVWAVLFALGVHAT